MIFIMSSFALALGTRLATIKIVIHGDAAPSIMRKICMWTKKHQTGFLCKRTRLLQ